MNANHSQLNARENLSPLPSNATEDSYIRYRAAKTLVALAPVSFGQEVILSGSTARGVADEVSDIEIVFYIESFPEHSEQEDWLRRVGAKDIVWENESADQIWVHFIFQEIWVEVGWQLLASHEKLLDEVASGTVTAHEPLTMAWIIQHAVPLRTIGLLQQWHQRFINYPETLAEHIITRATHFWFFPHFLAVRWALIHRGEHLALVERLYQDVCNMLRILFAINHQWEPDWKWLSREIDRLTIKPERLLERIDEIFLDPSLERRVTLSMRLLQDVIMLVPAQYDVARVQANIQESLRLHACANTGIAHQNT